MADRVRDLAARRFREWVAEDIPRGREDFRRFSLRMSRSTAKYQGEIIDFLYQPLFIDGLDLELFTEICSLVDSIGRKTVAEYLENPDFRKYWGYPKLLEELILADPGYADPAPMTRIDIFFSGGHENIRFCEINTDGTSGMNEVTEIEKNCLLTDAMSAAARDFEIHRFELIDPWIGRVLALSEERTVAAAESVVIADWEGCGVREEFKAFRRGFIRRGLDAVIADPRELKLRKGKLYLKDMPVDCVYRRAVTRECIERADEIRDLLDAYRDGNVCVVGGFRSQLLHSKIFFALASEGVFTPFLNKREAEFLERYLPRTVRLGGPGAAPGTGARRIPEAAFSDRENFILKPEDRYAAEDVYAGRDHTDGEWAEHLRMAAAAGGFILQEYVDLPKEPHYTFNHGKLTDVPCRNVLGLFSYGGKFSGTYTRGGNSSIIASRWKSNVLPTFLVR